MSSLTAYRPPTVPGPVDLDLSRNEGRAPRGFTPGEGCVAPDRLARYPNVAELRLELGRRFGLPQGRVVVTAGGDDALLRTCLATLSPGREALVATPTFEMIPRYAEVAGGTLRGVPWPEGAFPTDAFLDAASEQTAVAFVVSPNNPTGAVATVEDVRRIAAALPETLVVFDAAYGELDEEDPTPSLLDLPNVVVVRTLSKAWGLAGLRVGYALGSEAWIGRLAAHGNPFPVSGTAAELALRRLETGQADLDDYVSRVRLERGQLSERLRGWGARPAEPSRANFVLARGVDPAWVTAAAGALGVGLRAFPRDPALDDAVRITVPGREQAYARLEAALAAALAPEALLFDLDGVLADVSRSYRAAILGTAQGLGVALTSADVEQAKARGGANDDWELTWRLVTERGADASLAEVTERFERLYQGTPRTPGLAATEAPLVDRERLLAWRSRFRTAVVTGRPRADALQFLERFDLLEAFDALVCREDAPLKPDPAPVRLALERLEVSSAWMLGDTPDDLASARGAGVVPIGVVPPGADTPRVRETLERAGAARVLDRTLELEDLLS